MEKEQLEQTSRDDSDRNVSRPRDEDAVSQPRYIPIEKIAMINKHNQVYLFFTPLKQMTPEEKERLSKAWVNDGKYRGGVGWGSNPQ